MCFAVASYVCKLLLVVAHGKESLERERSMCVSIRDSGHFEGERERERNSLSAEGTQKCQVVNGPRLSQDRLFSQVHLFSRVVSLSFLQSPVSGAEMSE